MVLYSVAMYYTIYLLLHLLFSLHVRLSLKNLLFFFVELLTPSNCTNDKPTLPHHHYATVMIEPEILLIYEFKMVHNCLS
jgi:hypothetical protein